MDLTPRLLHDVEFSQEWRGYNREEVDEFLERVAASVEQLLSRLRDASARAAAEPAAAPDAVAPSGEEVITRTLVLAQRTADAAIAEAQESAAAVVAAAEEQAAAVLAAAEADGRRILDGARSGAAEEARRLEATRALLEADVEALEQHLAEQRRAVEAVVERLQAMLADPEAMRAGERPTLHVTTPVEPALDPPALVPPATVAPAPPAANGTAGAAPEVGEPDAAITPAPEEPDAAIIPAQEDDGGPPTMEVATVVVDDDAPIDLDAPAAAARTGHAPSAGGRSDDDPFLAELRKAVTDDEPLGPRDDDELMPAGRGIFDQDQLDTRDGLRSRLRRRP